MDSLNTFDDLIEQECEFAMHRLKPKLIEREREVLNNLGIDVNDKPLSEILYEMIELTETKYQYPKDEFYVLNKFIGRIRMRGIKPIKSK